MYPGMRNRACAGRTHAVPSALSPPAVTKRWTCGMVLERARPRVQDREHADLAADPVAVRRERLDGGRGFAEERGVDEPLVRARERRAVAQAG